MYDFITVKLRKTDPKLSPKPKSVLCHSNKIGGGLLLVEYNKNKNASALRKFTVGTLKNNRTGNGINQTYAPLDVERSNKIENGLSCGPK